MVAAVAAMAGADSPTAVRCGLAMTALQGSIGILNDIVDAPRDVGRRPPKPIPGGVVGTDQARAALVAVAAGGLGLSAGSGGVLLGLALIVLGIGYAYDLRLKGTAWSWVPFAVGIPLLPVFGWLGSGRPWPAAAVIVVPAAVLAGAGLAIANARADLEQDRASGTVSVATALGLSKSWWLADALFGIVAVVAVALLVGGAGQAGPPVLPLMTAIAGVVALGVGAVIGRGGSPLRRERAWECQAIGVAALAVGYLAAGAPLLR